MSLEWHNLQIYKQNTVARTEKPFLREWAFEIHNTALGMTHFLAWLPVSHRLKRKYLLKCVEKLESW